MTDPVTPESSERKLAEELDCGHPKACWIEDSSELEYIDGIPVARVGGEPAHCAWCADRAAIVQETLRAASEESQRGLDEAPLAASGVAGLLYGMFMSMPRRILAIATPAILERVAERERTLKNNINNIK